MRVDGSEIESAFMTSAERDILISRVVDGVADEADWKALDSIARSEPAIWRELAQSQRQQARLLAAVDEAMARVDGVGLPNPATYQFSARVSTIARWGGWAAAAAVALAWMGGTRPGPSRQNPNQASLVPLTASDAFSQYIQRGQEEGNVVSEVPDKLMIEAVPMGDGTFEVYFVRQIVERARVDNLYQQSFDETGVAKPGSVKVRLGTKTGAY